MTRNGLKRIRRTAAYVQQPAATATDRIAWRICEFAAGSEVGCACSRQGHGHCEAVGRVAGVVFIWAKHDLEQREAALAAKAAPLPDSDTGGRGA